MDVECGGGRVVVLYHLWLLVLAFHDDVVAVLATARRCRVLAFAAELRLLGDGGVVLLLGWYAVLLTLLGWVHVWHFVAGNSV